MAIGVSTSNWKIYQEQFWAGFTETIQQNVDAFNAASNGAITLQTQFKRGHFEQESFLQLISGLVSRRDITSVAAATQTPAVLEEFVRVKLNRKIGPVPNTLDAWKKIGQDPATVSFLLGRQMAPAILADYLNSALRAARASITAVAALNYDGTAGVLSFPSLIAGMSKLGDQGPRIAAWFMHSKAFFDLMSDSVSNYKIDSVGGVSIVTGGVAGLGKPIIFTDSPALLTAGVPDQYHTLGLVPGAVTVTESEDRQIESQIILQLENMVLVVQGEYAFNVGVRGAQWDITNGGINPTDAALATSTNWDTVVTDTKNNAGVRIYTD